MTKHIIKFNIDIYSITDNENDFDNNLDNNLDNNSYIIEEIDIYNSCDWYDNNEYNINKRFEELGKSKLQYKIKECFIIEKLNKVFFDIKSFVIYLDHYSYAVKHKPIEKIVKYILKFAELNFNIITFPKPKNIFIKFVFDIINIIHNCSKDLSYHLVQFIIIYHYSINFSKIEYFDKMYQCIHIDNRIYDKINDNSYGLESLQYLAINRNNYKLICNYDFFKKNFLNIIRKTIFHNEIQIYYYSFEGIDRYITESGLYEIVLLNDNNLDEEYLKCFEQIKDNIEHINKLLLEIYKKTNILSEIDLYDVILNMNDKNIYNYCEITKLKIKF